MNRKGQHDKYEKLSKNFGHTFNFGSIATIGGPAWMLLVEEFGRLSHGQSNLH
jgi:hypothetical protein